MQQSFNFHSEDPKPPTRQRGRPKAGVLRETTGVSLLPHLKDRLDQWAHRHKISRSRAIEILVGRGLR